MQRIEVRPPEPVMPPTMNLAPEREQPATRTLEFSPLTMALLMFDGEDKE